MCAMPLFAQQPARRVAAVCELTTASVVPSGKESESDGREYEIRVTNRSRRMIAMPRTPVFGWRVETLVKKDWKLKAEGGPVRRVSAKDKHIVVLGDPENAPLQEIAPANSANFYTFLPEAEKALKLDKVGSATFRVTLLWAAPAALSQSNPAVLPCALAPEWTLTVQRLESN